MDNITQLYIRACKSKDPRTRIRSTYRRFYGKYGEAEMNNALVHILASICDKYLDLSVLDLCCDLNPYKYLREDTRPYAERVVDVLASKIRLTEASVWLSKGYIKPLRFR